MLLFVALKATHSGVTEVCGSYESWRNGAKPFETSHVLERGDDIHHMKPHEKLLCVLRVGFFSVIASLQPTN